MTYNCCSMGESNLFLARKSGEGRGDMMRMCAFCTPMIATVSVFTQLFRWRRYASARASVWSFWTFSTLFSQTSLCAFLCLAFFNLGALDACYVSQFGGVSSVNLRSKTLFPVICLSRCVWDLFHSNIDVCCIRGKCD